MREKRGMGGREEERERERKEERKEKTTRKKEILIWFTPWIAFMSGDEPGTPSWSHSWMEGNWTLAIICSPRCIGRWLETQQLRLKLALWAASIASSGLPFLFLFFFFSFSPLVLVLSSRAAQHVLFLQEDFVPYLNIIVSSPC